MQLYPLLLSSRVERPAGMFGRFGKTGRRSKAKPRLGIPEWNVWPNKTTCGYHLGNILPIVLEMCRHFDPLLWNLSPTILPSPHRKSTVYIFMILSWHHWTNRSFLLGGWVQRIT